MMQNLVTVNNHKAVTTTLLVADSFNKQHKDVLRKVERLECSDEFRRRNFAPSSYLNEQNKSQPAYNITRDGFSFLCMGFTGKKAAEFKESFITAFNAMEQALLENQVLPKRSRIEHSRSTSAPGGLDIRYNLDLTKFVMKPSRSGLKVLSRLTGLDLDDLADDLDEHQVAAGRLTPEVVNFSRDFLTEKPGSWTRIENIYNAYRNYCAKLRIKPMVVGSFCRELRQLYPQIVRTRSNQGKRLWGYTNIYLLPAS